MTDNNTILIAELRKSGLHENLEFCKNPAEYLAQQAIELRSEVFSMVSRPFTDWLEPY